ncbi:hypothetical protein [Tellurirhabdus rosea]|uniref:hypothetical protein n=1 Tax=Tellurirhabdus rosea TaxID=2674997 RepID=UPI002251CAEF|nr:hypothetical protein [Tellurirhabdus rosea]
MAFEQREYNGDVGTFLRGADALERRSLYKKIGQEELEYLREKGYKVGDLTQAEFFGINRINQLLGRKDCVGIRIYYGFRWEDADGNVTREGEGELRPRLVLVGTRADGSDIFDSPVGLKGDGDGEALGDGLPCPQMCAP